MSRGFTLIEIMIACALLGVLAALAIPGYQLYVLRAKRSEGIMNVRRLFDSAAAYWMTEHGGPHGEILPKQFPDLVNWTPSMATCCSFPGRKCPASVGGLFRGVASWEALGFQMADPFYFSYTNWPNLLTGAGSNPGDYDELAAAMDGNCDLITQYYVRRRIYVTVDYQLTGSGALIEQNLGD